MEHSDYVILDTLYESPRTIVYKAIGKKNQKPYILKASRVSYSPDIATRYKREYEITSQKDIQGVVRAKKIEKLKDEIIIVFEDIGGESLKTIIKEKTFSLEDMLSLAIRIIEILGSIHSANIVHKDINPSNIVYNFETEMLQIIDFGISSILSVENPVMKNPNIMEGTLDYISPEQTGRMNRFIDYRTDFYSFGIMLYEMLTGEKPFKTNDPIELVHCHIAKQPVAPVQLNPKIPNAVSDIVMKLISKTAEDRYQSTIGIQTDLEFCLDHIIRDEEIINSNLGKNDIPERLKILGKLYGRKEEIQTLLTAFNNTLNTDPHLVKKEVVMVSGYSGIGKTSLVNEISTPISQKRGYFVSGKCEQFHGNTPYSALAMAFSQLIRQVLTEDEEKLEYFKSRLKDALENLGGVITDIVPELERIIGPQPKLQKLPPMQAQNRLNRVAKNLMLVFCKPEHPLVIFFDDLQWSDAATLNLLSLMIKDDELNHLFFIGAFRDNEVFPGHPLMNMIEEFKKKNIHINQIVLSPLDTKKTTVLLSNTLHQNDRTVLPLANLIIKKTGGNPFFINEFLKMLYRDEHLVFDLKKRSWAWNIEKIKKLSITDNVIDLMLKKIRMLPEYTQKTLGHAACIGNAFDLFILTKLDETDEADTMKSLQPALSEGLIIPTAGSEISDTADIMASELLFHQYQFLHDRFHQAAYALPSEKEKKSIHLKIGRILYQLTPEDKISEKIFEITDHFNKGGSLIDDETEALNIATLNLSAGKKAKDSTAYSESLAYFKCGINFLKNPWEKNYDLALALYQEQISSEYINGNFQQSESLIHEVMLQAKSDIDKAEVYSQLIVLYTMQTKYNEAIQSGIKALKLLEIIVPEKDIQDAIGIELQSVKKNLGNQKIMSLIDAPEMTSPEKKTAMKILMSLNGVAYFVDKYLYAWILARMTNISLVHGNTPEAAKGYASYGNVLVSFLNDYKTGYEFGILGVKMSEKYNNLVYKCQTCGALTLFINHWINPLYQSNAISQEGFQAGLESGELQYAGYNLMAKITSLFCQGKNLDKILVEADRYLKFNEKAKNQMACDTIFGFKLAITNLTGKGPGKDIFSVDGIDEKTYLKTCENNKAFAAIALFKIMKAQILFTYGNYDEAKKTFEDTQKLFSYLLGVIALAEYRFYESLCLIALYEKSSLETQKEYLIQIEEHQKQIKIWMENCPENFTCMDLLIAAEKARITNDDAAAAMDLYDLAIESAVENRFIQIEALANELAGKFWIGKHKNHIAELYLKNAYNGYIKWGATQKANAIQEEYSFSLDIAPYQEKIPGNELEKVDVYTDGKSNEYFDLAAVIKSYQAISSEIQLSSLLKKLMDILIENAGARKGILILEKNNDFWIEALGSVDADNVTLLSIKLENYEELAQSVIHYVIRTSESLVLQNAVQEGMFCHDPYIQQQKTRSIICIPIIHQAQLTGILYLENNLNTGVFTAARAKMLELLSSQAAIAIKNAKLYTRYRSLYDEAIEGIFQSTPEGRFTDVNPSIVKLLGYDSPEDLMHSLTDLENQMYVIPEDRERFRLSIKEDGKVMGFETQLYRKDGSILWGSLSARGIYDTYGKLMFYEGSVLDITERKKMEAAENERAAAQASSEAKSEFLANMSHEIRTPMNGIIGAADLAISESVSPKVQRYLQIISNSGQTLLGIINDILDFSKIEAGKLDLEIIPVNLSDLIISISDIFSDQTGKEYIEFLFDIEPNIPLAVYGDPTRIKQILTNLVSNAIKFTDTGGRIIVGIKALSITDENVQYEFFVKDTGKGMKKEYLEKLFDAFTQEESSTTRQYGGTGLGMSICKLLVGMMDGKIWVESEEGVGTTFFFTLELGRQPKDQEKEYSLPTGISHLKVMIVDDSKDNLNIMKKLFDGFGCESLIIENPTEAEKIFKSNTCDLVITDWQMPEMDGIELTRRLRKIKPEIPIIMLTSFGQEEERKAAQDAGIKVFLTKPISSATLYDAIMFVFGKRQKQKKVKHKTSVYQNSIMELDVNILLAEDNPTNQVIAKAVLKTAGIKVDIANNGLEAVDMVKKKNYDIVLMDMQMPKMDGYEATRTIRKDKQFAELPIIAMTAHAMKGDEEKCLNAGMDGYVTKPIRQETLFRTLWKKLESKSDTALLTDDENLIKENGNESPPEKLPGINVSGVLKSLCIDWPVYKTVLQGFRRNNCNTIQQMISALNKNDHDALRGYAHALKGSSANIGAQSLADLAATLENAAADNIAQKSQVDKIKTGLEEVFTSILSLDDTDGNNNDAVSSKQQLDPQITEDAINNLIISLEESDLGAIESGYKKIKPLFPVSQLSELENQLADYDFEKAVETLETLRKSLYN